MEHYSVIKNSQFMKFLGKWTKLENIILSEVTQSQKNTWYALTDKCVLAQKPRITKIIFIDQLKLKKEEQSMDTLMFHRRGTKSPCEEIHREMWNRD